MNKYKSLAIIAMVFLSTLIIGGCSNAEQKLNPAPEAETEIVPPASNSENIPEQASPKKFLPVEEQIIYVDDRFIRKKEQLDNDDRFINLGPTYTGLFCLDTKSIEIVSQTENECELTATVYRWDQRGTRKPHEPKEICYRYNLQEETMELWQDDAWQLIERVPRGRIYNALLTGEILYYKAFGKILMAKESTSYIQYLLRHDTYYYFDIASICCIEESADRVVLMAEAYYKLPSEDYLYPNDRMEFEYDLSKGRIFSIKKGVRDAEIVRGGKYGQDYLRFVAEMMYSQFCGEKFLSKDEA